MIVPYGLLHYIERLSVRHQANRKVAFLFATNMCYCYNRFRGKLLPHHFTEVNHMIEMKVKTVTVDIGGNFTVLLVDKEKEKMVLPIVIGGLEAHNIVMPIQGVEPPRPMTPDLLKTAIEKLGGVVEKVVITSIKGNTYYAEIHINQNGQSIVLDSRPSDAIALAVRCDIPIFMNRWLVEFTYDTSDIQLS